MGLKNTILSILTAGTILLTSKLAEGVNIRGFFLNSPACSTKIWRVNPPDTIFKETNSFGRWTIETNNFSPPANQGDSLYIEGGWNLGGNAKTSIVRGPPQYNSLDLTLNKHAGCIDEIIDTSGLHDSIPLMCEYWISGFDPETTQVDTGYSSYRYYDLHIPFDTLQAQQGAMAHYKLFKKVIDSPDTLYVKEDSFQINKDAFDGQLIRENDTFPKEKIIIGVEEQKQEVPKKGNFVRQSIGTRFDIQGSWELFDLIGNKVAEYQTDINAYKNHNLGMYPNGRYFLKSKDPNAFMARIVILK